MDMTVDLPIDADGLPIYPGDTLKLAHNGKTIKVRSIEYTAFGNWIIWPNGSGGGFSMPESAFNVTHVE